MPYAEGRTYLGADSHIMELSGFLIDNAEAKYRERIPKVPVHSAGITSRGVEDAERNLGHPPDAVAEMVELGSDLISGPKGYLALGAFNRQERRQALDQLGFDRQLVFSTFAAPLCFGDRT